MRAIYTHRDDNQADKPKDLRPRPGSLTRCPSAASRSFPSLTEGLDMSIPWRLTRHAEGRAVFRLLFDESKSPWRRYFPTLGYKVELN